MLNYIVYITINQCNGDFYIGVHETNPDVFDGYIGCGIYRTSDAKRYKNQGRNSKFINAVLKYGYENFKRTTLKIFPHTDEGAELAYDLEAYLVTETVLRSKTCLNTKVGGIEGGRLPKRRVYKFDAKRNFLQSYVSAKEAAIAMQCENVDSGEVMIRQCCLGKRATAFGFIWSYTKEHIKTSYAKPIAQYTLRGKFLRS